MVAGGLRLGKRSLKCSSLVAEIETKESSVVKITESKLPMLIMHGRVDIFRVPSRWGIEFHRRIEWAKRPLEHEYRGNALIDP
jgi:hypothetical protein